MNETARTAAETLATDCCAILLPSDTGEMILRAGHGWNDWPIGIASRDSHARHTLRSRESAVIDDFNAVAPIQNPEPGREHGIRAQ